MNTFNEDFDYLDLYDFPTPKNHHDLGEIISEITELVNNNLKVQSIGNILVSYVLIQEMYIKKRDLAYLNKEFAVADNCSRLIIWMDWEMEKQQKTRWEIEQTRKKKRSNKKEISTQLSDYWKSNNKSFRNCTDFLKQPNTDIDNSFIFIINGKLFWNRSIFKWRRYLIGFFYVLINKNLIKKNGKTTNFSSTDLLKIIEGTFNVTLNPKPLKSLPSNPPLKEFIKPFEEGLKHF